MAMLAWQQGWRDSALVARMVGVSRKHVRHIWRHHQSIDLTPATLCLADARLLAGVEMPPFLTLLTCPPR
jgi:hypothetical protein